MDNTNVVTLASGHIDAEAYFDSLHLTNEKGTKKLANDIKFDLGLKPKMQSANRDYYSHQEKPTGNSKSRPELPLLVTITPPRVIYAIKFSQSNWTHFTATGNKPKHCTSAFWYIPTAQDLNQCTENFATSAPALSTTTIDDIKPDETLYEISIPVRKSFLLSF